MESMSEETFEDAATYRSRLRHYSMEELEDIYYNIHLIKHPERYMLVRRELEARRLQPADADANRGKSTFRSRVEEMPWAIRRPVLGYVVVAISLIVISLSQSCLILFPMWLCAKPMHFVGFQASIAYIPLTMAAAVNGLFRGYKQGAKGWMFVMAIVGVAASGLLFYRVGLFNLIMEPLTAHQDGGGSLFNGF